MTIRIQSKTYKRICFVISCLLLIVFTTVCWTVLASSESDTQKLPAVSKPTADHSKFTILNKPMKQGPDATKACLSCHTEAAKQVQNTIHWTWGLDKMGKEGMGKARIINNF